MVSGERQRTTVNNNEGTNADGTRAVQSIQFCACCSLSNQLVAKIGQLIIQSHQIYLNGHITSL
jgi:hypothetical protein